MSYVAALFAFHSARASVVSVAQPTAFLLRTTHGLTTRAATPRRTTTASAARRSGRMSQATNTARASGEQGEARVRENGQSGDRTRRGDVPQRALLGGDENRERERGRQESVQHLAVDVNVVPDEIRMQRRDDGRQDADAA